MLQRHKFTIAIDTSLSAAVPVGGDLPINIQMPAAWDTANLTFQSSQDGLTYQNLYDANGVEVTVQAEAGRNIQLNPADFAGLYWLKIRSGTSSAPVNQTAERLVYLQVWLQ
jgi:hypothetical protein